MRTPCGRLPVIALTAGEPAGVGPELLVQLAQTPPATPLRRVALANLALLERRARAIGLPLRAVAIRREDLDQGSGDPAHGGFVPGQIEVIDHPLAADPVAGRLDPRNAGHVLALLETAVDGCLSGRFDAMVTGPLQKATILDAALPGTERFCGHTEWLAERAAEKLGRAVSTPVMLLTREAEPPLRVALVTTHLPLRAVPDAITAAAIEQVVRVLDHDLRLRFGLAQPRIAVCGLNPHAGEDGRLGDEERRIIAPTLERLRTEGLQLTGPLPADTAFALQRLADFDAYVAMYHDQGLPVLKHAGFGHSVNVTLGLPFVRTSVDHGTALNLAGTGRADVGSLRAAETLAARLVHRGCDRAPCERSGPGSDGVAAGTTP